MNVIRDIDIKDLKEVFKRQIDLAVKKELTNVRINYVTALRILDKGRKTPNIRKCLYIYGNGRWHTDK